MAEEISNGSAKRYAVVTGANKGIGFEVSKQLASQGVVVVLTARNEKRGLEALQKMKGLGLSDNVIFHQLDVTNTSSISSLAQFITTHFRRLDILVNNAGVGGVIAEEDALKAAGIPDLVEGAQINWKSILTESYELTVECMQTNYYGTKGVIETLLPLLLLSNSPRIVNVSSSMGKLQSISNGWAIEILNDIEHLTAQKVDEVVNEYLKIYKGGLLEANGWPSFMSAYIVSKAVMNAYARIVARQYPAMQVNCVCPGYVKTDMNYRTGELPVEQGAESIVRIALQPEDGPSGCFFDRKQASSF